MQCLSNRCFRDTGFLSCTSRVMGYYLFYFQGYGVFCSIFLFTFKGVGYLEKLIMGIFVSLYGILDCGYWIFVPSLYKPLLSTIRSIG